MPAAAAIANSNRKLQNADTNTPTAPLAAAGVGSLAEQGTQKALTGQALICASAEQQNISQESETAVPQELRNTVQHQKDLQVILRELQQARDNTGQALYVQLHTMMCCSC
jgi:hypothetical protein